MSSISSLNPNSRIILLTDKAYPIWFTHLVSLFPHYLLPSFLSPNNIRLLVISFTLLAIFCFYAFDYVIPSAAYPFTPTALLHQLMLIHYPSIMPHLKEHLTQEVFPGCHLPTTLGSVWWIHPPYCFKTSIPHHLWAYWGDCDLITHLWIPQNSEPFTEDMHGKCVLNQCIN